MSEFKSKADQVRIRSNKNKKAIVEMKKTNKYFWNKVEDK